MSKFGLLRCKFYSLYVNSLELFCGQIVEVATNTKVRDLAQTISTKLGLLSEDGFSIFVKTPDKVCAGSPATDPSCQTALLKFT